MELHWETTFSKTQLFDNQKTLIGVFEYNHSSPFKIADYLIDPFSFNDYIVKKSSENISFKFHLNLNNLALELYNKTYQFIYDNRLYCCLENEGSIVTSLYKEYGFFTNMGSITFMDFIIHKEIFAFSILMLRNFKLTLESE
jgi:hypothetical protein